MKGAYYNELDPFAAEWIRQLIKRGLIAPGDVDERDIREVRADDVKGYCQCHFFAGIGGWSYALRLAGWPDDRPVWTGSAPCQPFSSIGKGAAHGDERNLWPEMLRLIRECGPATIFGEQVDAAIRYGWLDGVFVDLEAEDYACGSAVLPAACVGSPHIRHRIFWLAYSESKQFGRSKKSRNIAREICTSRADDCASAGRSSSFGGIPNANVASMHRRTPSGEQSLCHEDGGDRWICHPEGAGLQGQWCVSGAKIRNENRRLSRLPTCAWASFDVLPFRDGKARRVESGTFPLAHGIPARMGRLRGYGNAIVPQLAAEFIRAFIEVAA